MMCVLSALSFGAVSLRSGITAGATLPRQADKTLSRLESRVVDVNGERRRVDPREGFSVVRGDLVTVIEVRLYERSKTRPIVDVLGYSPSQSTNHRPSNADDLGRVMDTARDFATPVGNQGGVARQAIRVLLKGVTVGETKLIIEPPRLISFDVAVNGVLRSVQEGEALSIGPHDGVEVLDVRTNIRGNENVRHDLSTVRGSDGRLKREIRFKRGDIIFAKVPVDWRGS